MLLLDLSAAFDTVNHDILVQRLQNLGIPGVALDWLRSFLTERLFQVMEVEASSSPRPLQCGVPQGSSLSPTLFNVYMAPLAELVLQFGVQIITYADDAQLVVTLKHPKSSPSSLGPCLEAVMDWMRHSHLKLNEEKTDLMLLGRASLLDITPSWPT